MNDFTITPLDVGGDMELDSGVFIKRKTSNQYLIDHPNFGHVYLTKEEIEELAELAGVSIEQ